MRAELETRLTGLSRGTGFVKFEEAAAAEALLDKYAKLQAMRGGEAADAAGEAGV